MNFIPKQPGLKWPPFLSVLTLFVIQFIVGFIVFPLLGIVSMILLRVGGDSSQLFIILVSGVALAGIFLGGLVYAFWAETKTAGALKQTSIIVALAFFWTIGQVIYVVATWALTWLLAPGNRSPKLPLDPSTLPLYFLEFLSTFLGLWLGRRLVEKRRKSLAA